MTREEELPLVIAAKAGNQAAIAKLHTQYDGMIRKAVRKYKALDTLTQDDLYQECYFYFVESLNKFDPSRNAKFGTYLHSQLMQISRYVTYQDFVIRRPGDYFAEIKSNDNVVVKRMALDAPSGDRGETVMDAHVDPYADFETAIVELEDSNRLKKCVKEVLASLNAVDRTIWELDIYSQKRAKRIAVEFDKYPRYIRDLKCDVNTKIRQMYERLSNVP